MTRRIAVALTLVVSLGGSADVGAQVGDGSLRGTVKDEQGAALPGVTVTATSPQLMGPRVTVTDGVGEYRIMNLPPGQYTLAAELAGFALFRREGIVVRAAATFQVDDMIMRLGTLEESITVSGRSPMVEVASPTSTMNIEAEFQKAVPLTEGGFWIDFLQMTPGVLSRPHNDGSGRQNYYAQGVEHREHVTQMDGLMAGNYWDLNLNRTSLSGEVIADTNVKLGGVDASAPMGYGLVVNMISKSGGNQLSGSAAYTLQSWGWNADNSRVERDAAGMAATRSVNQADVSLGGPIKVDRTWFFTAYRLSRIHSTPDRSPLELEYFGAFRPDIRELPLSTLESHQPWVRVTSRITPSHELVGIYQYDRMRQKSVRSRDSERTTTTDVGGPMYGFNFSSVWGESVTTRFAGNYNNKRGNDWDSYSDRLMGLGPSWNIHQAADENVAGFLTGSGALLTGGGYGTISLEQSDFLMLRGDLTWFRNDRTGSHEWQTGFLMMPRNRYKGVSVALDDFISENRRLVDPDDLYSGTIPFSRTFRTSALEHVSQQGQDHDYAVYVQNTWRPVPRLTATLGVRADFVQRYDVLRDLVIQRSTEIGPRLGGAFLLTNDGRNVVRASFARVHRQLMGGRDSVASFGTPPGVSSRTIYDLNGDGIFDAEDVAPAIPLAVNAHLYDPDFNQPFVDEYIVGYQRQLPVDMSLDVSLTTKAFRDQYAQVEINGFWPEEPFQPFGGFGRVDPNLGTVYRLTNNTWASAKYRAVMITLAKNMSHGFQLMASLQRQWQFMDGTWNPTDPARFIQPDAYPNNRTIWRQQSPIDHNSLATGGALRNVPTWTPGSFRLAGTWHAPRRIVVSGSYTMVGGPWTGPILQQLPANHPDVVRFGPARMVHPETGASFPNPLATRIRFLHPTRGDGQALLPWVHTVNLRLGYRIELGGERHVQLGANIFNLLNAGRYTEWHRSGANLSYSPSVFLLQDNQQPSRAAQINVTYRF